MRFQYWFRAPGLWTERTAVRRGTRLMMGAGLSVLAGACIDATGISREYLAVTPEVATLDARVAGDLLVVELVVTESVEIPDSARIPVAVTSSSGDSELMLARPYVCNDPTWGLVFCGEVVVGIKPGDGGSVPQRLRDHSAFILYSLGGGSALVTYWPYGSLHDILKLVDGWPGVRYVEPNIGLPGAADLSGKAPPPPMILAYMAIENTTVTPGNDYLEAAPAQSLRVEYTPADRPALVNQIMIP